MKKKIILMVILTFAMTCSIFADTDDYFEWNWKDDRIELQVMVGVTNYSGDIYQTYQDWNYISFVNINGISNGTNFWTSPDDDIYLYDASLGGTTLARTYTYSQDSSGQYTYHYIVNSFQDIGKVTIRIDPVNNKNRGTTDVRRTLTHEFGHALGLAHPGSGETDRCIMQQSKSDYSTYSIKDHDKFNLMSKWSLMRY